MFKTIFFILALFSMIAGCSVLPKPEGSGQKPATIVSPTIPDKEISSVDDLVKQLQASGATVEMAGSIQQPFFSVPGQKLTVNGQDVQVFEYTSKDARQVESSQISKDGSTIGTSMVSWMEPPHFWATGKLITLYVGKNQEVVGLITQVLGGSINQP